MIVSSTHCWLALLDTEAMSRQKDASSNGRICDPNSKTVLPPMGLKTWPAIAKRMLKEIFFEDSIVEIMVEEYPFKGMLLSAQPNEPASLAPVVIMTRYDKW